MSDSQSSSNKRRTTVKRINYDERKADAELAKRIKQLEKSKVKGSNKTSGKQKSLAFKYQRFLQDKTIPWNFIPSLPATFRKHSRFSNILDLDEAFVNIKEQVLMNSSNVILKKNEHIYMISEPPGEPYYVGRIVEFIAKPEFREKIISAVQMGISHVFPAKYFQLCMNWYYRARDIQDNPHNANPRLLYASLHNDICPIQSYRGKCTVLHKSKISSSNFEEYTMKPSVFIFEQLFDRYLLSYYDVWSTAELLKLNPKSSYLIGLSERFPYVFTEVKYPLVNFIRKYILAEDFTSEKSSELWDQKCGHCKEWCEPAQTIRCDTCKIPLHLYCLDPPLDRKPGKGVSWICYTCVLRQNNESIQDDDCGSELIKQQALDLEKAAYPQIGNGMNRPNCWYQYFGSKLICHLEDCLSVDMVIPYPLKCSRIGSKNQWSECSESEWVPRPYYGADGERGEDSTSQLLWALDTEKISADEVDNYVQHCSNELPKSLGITPQATNFLDMAMKALVDNQYNCDAGFNECKAKMTRDSLKEPTFTKEEVKRFEQAVAEHGSELHPVCKKVKTQPMSMIVRFYYIWKKTESGRRIWGNFKGRKKNEKGIQHIRNENNDSRKSRTRKRGITDKTENPDRQWRHVDDSCFDSEKINKVKASFQCMFCDVDYSPLWYRVTGGSDDENIQSRMKIGVNEKTINSDKLPSKLVPSNEEKLEALCIRCARLWRRYAIRWQQPMEVLKKLNGTSTNNLQSSLLQLLDDPNDSIMKSSSQQTHSKQVEWELVQDTELIIKQRFSMISNPMKLLKMKRNCMSMHGQLNKSVKKLLTTTGFSNGQMQAELENYIDNCAAEIRKKEQRIQKNCTTLPKVENEDKQDKLIQAINVDHKDTIICKRCEDDQVDELHKAKKPRTNIQKSHSGSSIILQVPGIADNNETEQITVDSQFEYIRIPESIHHKLFGEMLQSNSINGSLKAMNDAKFNTNNQRPYFARTQPMNDSNIPIVRHTQWYDGILKEYNKLNPHYCSWINTNSNDINSDTSKTSGRSKMLIYSPKAGRKSKPPPSSVESSSVADIIESRDICCVCMDKFDGLNDVELTCYNCGLNIHPCCYGVRFAPGFPSSDYPWLCDPCSNDRNPLVSTNYQCSLCHAREIDHDSSKRKVRKAVPDALKLDVSGSWCHVICAMFNENVKFGLVNNYQPLYNVGATLLENNGKKCAICNMLGGGLVQCEKCSFEFHVTCAQDSPNFTLCFRRFHVESNPVILPSVEDNGERYTIKPSIICSHHSYEEKFSIDTLPLSYKLKTGQTLVKYFLDNYKSSSAVNGYTTIGLRINEFNLWTTYGKEKSNIFSLVNNTLEVEKPSYNKCIHCSTKTSIHWFGNICHGCFISSNRSLDICDIDDDIFPIVQNSVSPSLCENLLEGIDTSKLSMEFHVQQSTKIRRKGGRYGKRNLPRPTLDTTNVVVQTMGTNLPLESNQRLNGHNNDMSNRRILEHV
ncbi:DNA-binding E3 ubiquitin-protein ligase SNT2 Ecym_2187 [Eremothecium cymbalariae DBVPG|uniref:Uncharacterized protein n=1 Tax=Eremothecium cymbalariae (strain CBS 270.75 / DBVPG 7215 / KCTC 17166 / NRRL Y-17582) TaxID=931890 RepID=G8JP31_ERECY|nr:Hypothetical protein Ecym_2187 [Eremothecium cymbalariae DBVPG\